MMDSLDARRGFAVDVALRAGALALGMHRTLAPIEAKSAIDFCTEADRAVEQLVRQEIAERFGDAVIGEEYGGDAADRVWVVDPIDGTAGYIHGTNRWCVSLAYVWNGEIEIGVIYAPADDRLFVAQRGRGATLNGRPIQVSGLRHGAAPVVELGWSERRPLSAYCTLLQRLTDAGFEFRRHGSGALGLADMGGRRRHADAARHRGGRPARRLGGADAGVPRPAGRTRMPAAGRGLRLGQQPAAAHGRHRQCPAGGDVPGLRPGRRPRQRQGGRPAVHRVRHRSRPA
jgi:myo-inositol-1(or 4)-monophosphatase